jgi:dolichol-phosphate mannosyltransferase
MDGQMPAVPAYRLSLVLPAYNEAAGIRQAIAEADAALARLCQEYEILVVDDGSSDATAAFVAEEAALRPQVRLLRHEQNRGYGAALCTGFGAARFELVAFTDADCQFHLDDLNRLLPLTAQAPLVAGYREGRQDSWRRRFLSGGFNLLARALLGTRVRDCDCALKVFRRGPLAQLLPQTNGFFVNAEMLARARQLGYDVAEAGVRHRPRLHGVSKVSLSHVPRVLATILPFWWSRVLFPGRAGGVSPLIEQSATSGSIRGLTPPARLALAMLAILAGLLFFGRLRAPLLEPQEPRYAEIARQMLVEGRLLVPVLHGQPYLDKPPLLYWLTMGSYALCGVHDWAARLVPGLAGFLTVLLTYLWGRRTVGERAALCGALVLCLSARFVYLGRMLTMDSVLCLWVTAALATAHWAVSAHRPTRGWWLLSATMCGLGLLTKGPVALVLVVPPLLAHQMLDPRAARLRWTSWAAYLGIALGLAAPWYIAVMAREPHFAGYFFWKHNVVRFLAPFDHEEPAWFFLPSLLLGMLPWTLLLPGLVRFLARHSARTAAQRPTALGFFLLAFLWSLLFFSAAGSKRAVYILPAMPPFALALGCYLDVIVPHVGPHPWAALWRWRSRLAYVSLWLVLIAGVGVVTFAVLQRMVKPSAGLPLAAAVVVGFLVLPFVRRAVSWGVCSAVTFVVLFAGVQTLLPAYNRQFALRSDLRALADHTDTARLPVVCYPQRYDSASFYLPQAEVRVYTAEQRRQLLDDLRARPETLLLVKSGRSLRELVDDLPESLEFVARGGQGAVVVGRVRARPEPGGTMLATGGTELDLGHEDE